MQPHFIINAGEAKIWPTFFVISNIFHPICNGQFPYTVMLVTANSHCWPGDSHLLDIEAKGAPRGYGELCSVTGIIICSSQYRKSYRNWTVTQETMSRKVFLLHNLVFSCLFHEKVQLLNNFVSFKWHINWLWGFTIVEVKACYLIWCLLLSGRIWKLLFVAIFEIISYP